MRDEIIILVYYLCSIPYYQEVKMNHKTNNKRLVFLLCEIARIHQSKLEGIITAEAANFCLDSLMTLTLYFNSSDYLALIDSQFVSANLIKTSGWKFRECA